MKKKSNQPLKLFFRWTNKNSNLIASLLTFITILVTIYYSSKNFNLADKQYRDLLAQRALDSIKNRKEQERSNVTHTQDSLGIEKRDIEQRKRWQEQYEINKQQLIAFKQQAENSRLQFENQRDAYLTQKEIDRPNIIFSMMNIDTLPNSQSIARIFFINSGKSNTIIKRIVVFGWDITTNQWTNRNFPDDIEANSSVSVSVDLNLPAKFVVNTNTVYYIRVYYTDIDRKIIYKDIFGHLDLTFMPKIGIKTISVELQTAFKTFLMSKQKNFEVFLNEPDVNVQTQF